MRKLRAYVQIQAPVQTVQQLADRRRDWMVTQGSILVRTLSESWEATETEGGTRFTVRMEYQGRIPLVEELVADSMQESLVTSLDRLKHLAETDKQPRLH